MTRTDTFHAGTVETSLSLAVRLRDAYTGTRPRGSPTVRLLDRHEQFFRNRSGVFVLTDLPSEVSSLTIDVDGGTQYLPERRVVDATVLDQSPPLLDVELLPSPAYRFHADATLVRGHVGEAQDGEIIEPLPNVELTIETPSDDQGSESDGGLTAMGRSDAAGEYVLFIRGLSRDTVVPTDGGSTTDARERVVQIGGERPTVRAVDPETDRQRRTKTDIVEGAVTSLNVHF